MIRQLKASRFYTYQATPMLQDGCIDKNFDSMALHVCGCMYHLIPIGFGYCTLFKL